MKSNSILSDKTPENPERKPEDILAETFGCFESSETVEEIIDDIYRSRHFQLKTSNYDQAIKSSSSSDPNTEK